ncbi:MAG: ParB/RepB/Spo0J family partition protein [Chloracidobacterium sp.]|uniref:ParB/RepB/Spo0J family partition protein n=1 Tax=Chloracidobacterium validum TaxID=2821543 RepID=A0ABX8BB07_9BACT|nr:ParB/RepB/Spo0J family partition protein [Chloracidobacterium validum]QUW02849.1 ParB/RepB/Spo0J family partition protein [Chloracidobacterium validum]
MTTRRALGRGLSALLPERPPQTGEELLELDIERVIPNIEQPRATFHEGRLEELAQSIREHGVLQPIVVRRQGEGFQIIAGERRWRAAQRAGLHRIPAVVRDVPDDRVLELALIENIQREDLTPIEEAQAYRRLMDELGLTQEQAAARLGKDRATIANAIRLLRLPSDIQKLIEERLLSPGHARALLALDSDTLQRRVVESVIERALSVRETERLVKRVLRGEPVILGGVHPTDPNVKFAESKLSKLLGTKVRIVRRGRGGCIEIEYYGTEDLDRLYNRLLRLGDN